MKNSIIKYSIAIIVIILLGILFRDETFFFNIGDTYYVFTYLTLSLFLALLFFLIWLIVVIRKRKT